MTAMKLRAGLLAGLVLGAVTLLAQRYGGSFGRGESFVPDFAKNGEFHFIRTEYYDGRRGFGGNRFVSRTGRASGWWAQDWPDADNHFSFGIQRLTRLQVGEPVHLALTDPNLFDYPWIYATQTGYWELSDEECKKLREYLDRGGFLMVDDFWGPGAAEWEVFQDTMERVLPGHPIVKIDLKDTVMHVLYDIEQKDLTFIPGTRHLDYNGGVRQPAGTSPQWDAINDDRGRMVVAVNYNTDIGDAWEYADAPEYPAAMTTLAYRYGINYIMYAMTH
jgi:Domain of unknown function (DUF4159)